VTNDEKVAVQLAEALTQQVIEHEPVKIAQAEFPYGASGVMGIALPNCVVVGIDFAPGFPIHVVVMN